MTVTTVLDVAAGVLLLAGAALSLIAAIGLLRFPDLLTRMHSATKPQVLGLMLVALGLSLTLRDLRVVAVLVLVVGAQMVTGPIAAHMLGRAGYRAGQVRPELLLVDELSDVQPPDADHDRGAP